MEVSQTVGKVADNARGTETSAAEVRLHRHEGPSDRARPEGPCRRLHACARPTDDGTRPAARSSALRITATSIASCTSPLAAAAATPPPRRPSRAARARARRRRSGARSGAPRRATASASTSPSRLSRSSTTSAASAEAAAPFAPMATPRSASTRAGASLTSVAHHHQRPRRLFPASRARSCPRASGPPPPSRVRARRPPPPRCRAGRRSRV